MSQRQLRVPLGWSGDAAAAAERTQTTLSEGPCLNAAAASAALVVDADAVAGTIACFLDGVLDDVYEYEVEPPSWW